MNIDNEIDKINKDNKLIRFNNGILIESKYLDILNIYNINPNNYSNLSSLIFEIELVLNDYDLDDNSYEALDNVCKSLQEKNYYLNTNK